MAKQQPGKQTVGGQAEKLFNTLPLPQLPAPTAAADMDRPLQAEPAYG